VSPSRGKPARRQRPAAGGGPSSSHNLFSAGSAARISTSRFAYLMNLLWDVPAPDRNHPVVIFERAGR